MAGIECPRCGLLSPESAGRCDCGYVFKGQATRRTSSGQAVAMQSDVFPPRVSVIDINIPFESMVIFMVKWAVASIPAFVILFLLSLAALMVVRGFYWPLGGLLTK